MQEVRLGLRNGEADAQLRYFYLQCGRTCSIELYAKSLYLSAPGNHTPT